MGERVAGLVPSDAPSEVFPVLTCVLAYPTRRWCDDPTLGAASVALRYPGGVPGMGYPLTAEFLRNLGYSGFKPDRHIVRLLHGLDGGNGVPDQSRRAAALSKVAGRPRAKDVTETIRTCLVGAAITPDENYSRTDNGCGCWDRR